MLWRSSHCRCANQWIACLNQIAAHRQQLDLFENSVNSFRQVSEARNPYTAWLNDCGGCCLISQRALSSRFVPIRYMEDGTAYNLRSRAVPATPCTAKRATSHTQQEMGDLSTVVSRLDLGSPGSPQAADTAQATWEPQMHGQDEAAQPVSDIPAEEGGTVPGVVASQPGGTLSPEEFNRRDRAAGEAAEVAALSSSTAPGPFLVGSGSTQTTCSVSPGPAPSAEATPRPEGPLASLEAAATLSKGTAEAPVPNTARTLPSPGRAGQPASGGEVAATGGQASLLRAVVTPGTPAVAQEAWHDQPALHAPGSLAGSSDVGGMWEGMHSLDAAAEPEGSDCAAAQPADCRECLLEPDMAVGATDDAAMLADGAAAAAGSMLDEAGAEVRPSGYCQIGRQLIRKGLCFLLQFVKLLCPSFRDLTRHLLRQGSCRTCFASRARRQLI